MTATTRLDLALDYARRGWPVFPLAAGTKIPTADSNGVDDATTDPEQITAWWAENPDYNIGIACGVKAGLLVIDVDRDPTKGKHGDADLEDAERNFGALPDTPTALTPSGGEHRYYRHPGKEITVRAIGHLDIQRDGLYVVAPGSSTKAGEYAWELSAHIDEVDIAELPEAWVEMLTKVHEIPERKQGNTGGTIFHAFNDAVDLCRILFNDGATIGPVMNGRPRGKQPGGPYIPITRPGKDERKGPSARLWLGSTQNLYVFSTDWGDGIQGEHLYDASEYWCVTRFHGDKKAFWQWLWDEGYRGETPKRPRIGDVPPAEAQPAEDPWEATVPLGIAATQLPTFPVHVFPEWIADQCREVAQSIQAPIDAAAMMAIGMLSTICAGRIEVGMPDEEWTEPTNTWMAVAMRSGTGKGPVYSKMMAPVHEIDKQRTKAAQRAVAEYEAKLKEIERQKADKEKNGDVQAAASLAVSAGDLVKPNHGRLFGTDATPEALVTLMADNGGVFALHNTEAGILDMVCGRYQKGGVGLNLDVYLNGFSRDVVRVDRKTGPSFSLDKPTLTIAMMVQPSVIERMADIPELENRGLVPRLMFSYPTDMTGRRNMGRPAKRERTGVSDEYQRMVHSIANHLAKFPDPTVIRMSDAAADVFYDFRQEMEERVVPYVGDLRSMSAWVTKMVQSMVRVSGLLHIAHGGAITDRPEIDADVMEDAVQVARYWIEHTKAVYDVWGITDEAKGATQILRWCKARRLSEFTVRECFDALRSTTFPTADSMCAAFDLLAACNWLRRLEGKTWSGKGGGENGQGSPRVLVNPELHRVVVHESASHAAQKGPLRALREDPTQNSAPAEGNSGSVHKVQNGPLSYVDVLETESQGHPPAEPAELSGQGEIPIEAQVAQPPPTVVDTVATTVDPDDKWAGWD